MCRGQALLDRPHSLVVDMANQRLDTYGTHFLEEAIVVCESTLCASITFAVVQSVKTAKVSS